MENTPGMPGGDGLGEEDPGKDGPCLDFGYPSSHLPYQSRKLIRTDTFPFRMAPPRSPTTVTATTSGARAGPPLSRHPFASPFNNNIVSGGGGTAVFSYNSAISDSFGTPRTLQPFANPFKSLGKAGDATLQLCSPFTAAQWQELHQQALIFKYIVASTPVPPELLFCSGALPDSHPLISNLGRGGDYLNLRFTGNIGVGNLEPGRCRRTDGKKWRCSRDVAPGQKYCERHMHRARPRSRRPVEHDKRAGPAAPDGPVGLSSTSAGTDGSTPASTSNPSSGVETPHPEYSSHQPVPSVDLTLPFEFMVPHDKKLSDFGSGRGDDVEAQAGTQHGQLLSSKTGSGSDTSVWPQQHYEDQANLHCTSLDDQRGHRFDTIISSLEGVPAHDLFHRGTPRRFIDAWSRENLFGATINEKEHYKTSGGGSSPGPSSLGNISPSNLTLAMAGSWYGTGEVQDQTLVGLGAVDPVKPQAPSWKNPASPVGGPLAEVLQSGNVSLSFQNDCGAGKGVVSRAYAGETYRMSKSSCGGEGASPRGSTTTHLSSPTAVLQKTLVSLSDSSGNSSPTTFGPGPRPPLQWRATQ